MKRFCALAVVLLSLTPAIGSAQSHTAPAEQGLSGQSNPARGKSAERRATSITGRVVGDSAQPVSNATIRVLEAGKLMTMWRTTNTDGEGRFRVEDLTRGLYFVQPNAPGYVADDEVAQQKLRRPGDNVTITLVKGGVITGTVTDSAGEPKVAIRIRALRVRDKEGRAVPRRVAAESQTDDRGTYRIYGMQTGSYVIQANDREPYYGVGTFGDEVPTYYPSSTIDTATPVSVRAGEEITGIDIRYRGEQGHAVSGAFSGADLPGTNNRGAYLILTHDPGNLEEAQTYAGMNGRGASFAFYGVPDGDYYLYARSVNNEKGEVSGSGRVRVKVKGADVTGLEITLAPLGSIAGSVKLEPLREADQKSKCESKSRTLSDEILIAARRDEKENKSEPVSENWSRYQSAPTDKGEFTIINIEPGSYRLGYNLPGEDLYVRSVTLPPPAPARPAIDVARNSLAVKSGQRISGLSVTISEGAAAIKGKVVAASEGAQLPAGLRLHLIPAEKESAEDTLRFAEVAAQSDGSFSIANIAPGRYFVLARLYPDEVSTNSAPRPVAWDGDGRKRLLREGEAANVVVELQPCQRITDYALRYKKQ
ncbi:MAG TPA: carboxypeptidase-like regulatory domain-containing protein [Blastocatellia bacterium]|nr:carboxypeptidase-like regulatory domain-containing protein [Blastocatellia bacterium]